MGHFLDALPFDYSRRESRELRDLLVSSYEREQDTRKLLAEIGFPTYAVNFAQAPIYFWHELLIELRNADLLRKLIDAVKADPRRAALRARLDELTQDLPIVEAADDASALDADDALDAEPEQLELLLHKRSTLLDLCFLEGGLQVAPAIARLTVQFPRSRSYGTGFLIAGSRDGLLLTNHHVLFDVTHECARAESVEVWFSYEKTTAGGMKKARVYRADPSTIVAQRELDWAAIRITEPMKEPYPRLALGAATPPEIDDRAYIIQHPEGMPKQIGMHRNVIVHVDDRVIQYLTDTKAGSSGAPVFNERWEVIALHHRWIPVPRAEGKPPMFRNQGVRIERVREGLAKAGYRDAR